MGLQRGSKIFVDHFRLHYKLSRTSLGPKLSARANGIVARRLNRFLHILMCLDDDFLDLIPILSVKLPRLAFWEMRGLTLKCCKKFFVRL